MIDAESALLSNEATPCSIRMLQVCIQMLKGCADSRAFLAACRITRGELHKTNSLQRVNPKVTEDVLSITDSWVVPVAVLESALHTMPLVRGYLNSNIAILFLAP